MKNVKIQKHIDALNRKLENQDDLLDKANKKIEELTQQNFRLLDEGTKMSTFISSKNLLTEFGAFKLQVLKKEGASK